MMCFFPFLSARNTVGGDKFLFSEESFFSRNKYFGSASRRLGVSPPGLVCFGKIWSPPSFCLLVRWKIAPTFTSFAGTPPLWTFGVFLGRLYFIQKFLFLTLFWVSRPYSRKSTIVPFLSRFCIPVDASFSVCEGFSIPGEIATFAAGHIHRGVLF